jgi:hypothetical protein
MTFNKNYVKESNTVLLKSDQKFCGNVITEISRLSDRMTWIQHVSFFFRGFFETFFTPSVLRIMREFHRRCT